MGRDSQPMKPNPLTKRRKKRAPLDLNKYNPPMVVPLTGAETFHVEDFEGVPPSQWYLVRAGWWPPQKVAKEVANTVAAFKEVADVRCALRNFKLNGSNAAKQILGIYADLELATREARELREKVTKLEARIKNRIANEKELRRRR